MAEALIVGDIRAAWSSNPLVLVVVALVGIRTVGWMLEVVRSPRAPSLRWLPAWWHRYWFWIVLVVSVAYVLVRNIGVA